MIKNNLCVSDFLSERNTVKNFSYVIGGKFFGALLQGIFYLAFANLLEPESYGQMSYLIAIAGTFSIIFRFGFPLSITVFQAKKNSELSNQINILATITITTASIILIFIEPITALLCFGLSLFVLNQRNLLGLKKYKKQMWLSILKGVLILIIPLSFYPIWGLEGIILGMILGNIISSFTFFSFLKKINSFNLIKKNFRVILNNFGLDVSLTLPRVVDKLVIVPILGFATVGIYQFNLQILFLIEMLPISLHSFLLSEESSNEKIKKFYWYPIIGAIGITIIGIIVSPFVINEYFPKYYEGIFGLQIILLSLVPLTLSSIINAKLQAKESTKIGFSAFVRIGSLLFLIVLLGEQFEIIGLSIAVLVSSVLNLLFLYILFKRLKE